MVTASFSWRFVASTDNRDWMSGSTLDSPEMAPIQEEARAGSTESPMALELLGAVHGVLVATLGLRPVAFGTRVIGGACHDA